MGVCEFDQELFKLMQRLDQNHGVWVLQGAGGNSDTNVPYPQMASALSMRSLFVHQVTAGNNTKMVHRISFSNCP